MRIGFGDGTTNALLRSMLDDGVDIHAPSSDGSGTSIDSRTRSGSAVRAAVRYCSPGGPIPRRWSYAGASNSRLSRGTSNA